ncbi:hypothetical protein J6590_078392, partial [Homalodisca vitripennis]
MTFHRIPAKNSYTASRTVTGCSLRDRSRAESASVSRSSQNLPDYSVKPYIAARTPTANHQGSARPWWRTGCRIKTKLGKKEHRVKPNIAARTPTANQQETRAHGGERDARSSQTGEKEHRGATLTGTPTAQSLYATLRGKANAFK